MTCEYNLDHHKDKHIVFCQSEVGGYSEIF